MEQLVLQTFKEAEVHFLWVMELCGFGFWLGVLRTGRPCQEELPLVEPAFPENDSWPPLSPPRAHRTHLPPAAHHQETDGVNAGIVQTQDIAF